MKGHCFPASFGFTGSSHDGPVPVRAYQRGGRVLPAKPASMKPVKLPGGAKKTLRASVIPSSEAAKPAAGKKLMPGYKKGGGVKGKLRGALSRCS